MHSVQVIGTQPYCEDFDSMRDGGVMSDRSLCGICGNWTVEELRHKLWMDKQEMYGCDAALLTFLLRV